MHLTIPVPYFIFLIIRNAEASLVKIESHDRHYKRVSLRV